jgi:hypothetical protein
MSSKKAGVRRPWKHSAELKARNRGGHPGAPNPRRNRLRTRRAPHAGVGLGESGGASQFSTLGYFDTKGSRHNG